LEVEDLRRFFAENCWLFMEDLGQFHEPSAICVVSVSCRPFPLRTTWVICYV